MKTKRKGPTAAERTCPDISTEDRKELAEEGNKFLESAVAALSATRPKPKPDAAVLAAEADLLASRGETAAAVAAAAGPGVSAAALSALSSALVGGEREKSEVLRRHDT